MREARRLEQSHNPNYLKSKPPAKAKTLDKDAIDDIPIQELHLDVPIKITCKLKPSPICNQRKSYLGNDGYIIVAAISATKRSDKYLMEAQSKKPSKKKTSKKGKKSKKSKHKDSSSESDEGKTISGDLVMLTVAQHSDQIWNLISFQNRKLYT